MYGRSGSWYILKSDFSRKWLSNEKSTLNRLIESGGPTTRVAKNQRHVERICHFRAADQDRRPEREKNHSTTLSTLENVSSRPLWRSWTRLSATNHPAIVTNRPNLVAVETRFTHTNFFVFIWLLYIHFICCAIIGWKEGSQSLRLWVEYRDSQYLRNTTHLIKNSKLKLIEIIIARVIWSATLKSSFTSDRY